MNKPRHPPDLLDHTIAVFQPRTTRTLDREDAREIVENLTGFFRVLRDWEQKQKVGGDNASG